MDVAAVAPAGAKARLDELRDAGTEPCVAERGAQPGGGGQAVDQRTQSVTRARQRLLGRRAGMRIERKAGSDADERRYDAPELRERWLLDTQRALDRAARFGKSVLWKRLLDLGGAVEVAIQRRAAHSRGRGQGSHRERPAVAHAFGGGCEDRVAAPTGVCAQHR
jgi:hypothetical protein